MERGQAQLFAYVGGALVAGGLLDLEDGDRPFLSRALRVPDAIAEDMPGRIGRRAMG